MKSAAKRSRGKMIWQINSKHANGFGITHPIHDVLSKIPVSHCDTQPQICIRLPRSLTPSPATK
jgi:hypothetical protein